MKTLSKSLGLLSLLLLFLIPLAYLFDYVSFSLMTTLMLAGSLLWYATAFFWIGRIEPPKLDDDPML